MPLFPGDHVTDDAGTGFVHTAPSHGDDDYQIGLKHGLKMTFNIEADGSYRRMTEVTLGAFPTDPTHKVLWEGVDKVMGDTASVVMEGDKDISVSIAYAPKTAVPTPVPVPIPRAFMRPPMPGPASMASL